MIKNIRFFKVCMLMLFMSVAGQQCYGMAYLNAAWQSVSNMFSATRAVAGTFTTAARDRTAGVATAARNYVVASRVGQFVANRLPARPQPFVVAGNALGAGLVQQIDPVLTARINQLNTGINQTLIDFAGRTNAVLTDRIDGLNAGFNQVLTDRLGAFTDRTNQALEARVTQATTQLNEVLRARVAQATEGFNKKDVNSYFNTSMYLLCGTLGAGFSIGASAAEARRYQSVHEHEFIPSNKSLVARMLRAGFAALAVNSVAHTILNWKELSPWPYFGFAASMVGIKYAESFVQKLAIKENVLKAIKCWPELEKRLKLKKSTVLTDLYERVVNQEYRLMSEDFNAAIKELRAIGFNEDINGTLIR